MLKNAFELKNICAYIECACMRLVIISVINWMLQIQGNATTWTNEHNSLCKQKPKQYSHFCYMYNNTMPFPFPILWCNSMIYYVYISWFIDICSKYMTTKSTCYPRA